MRVAMIGCGFISDKHAAALLQRNQTIVIAIDASLARAEEYASRWNIGRYNQQFEDALTDDIDCIHICTPPTLHYEMVKKALLANKHVICEKPLCLNADEARELMELARERNLITAVDFNVRYHDACQRAREIIHSESFGRVNLIHGTYLQEFHALPADYMWRYQPSLAGNMRAVTEIGSHWIDLVRYLTGLEITAVSANFGKFDPERYIKDGVMYREASPGAEKITVDTDDAAIVSLRFSNGAIGSMVLSEVSHGRSNHISVEITGAQQSLWWNSEDPYRTNASSKFNGVVSSVNAFDGGYRPTFEVFFDQVYACILSGKSDQKEQFPTFYDGYVNAAVCEAIYRSAQNNSVWTEVM